MGSELVCAAKKNSGRLIPLHSELRTALSTWRSLSEGVFDAARIGRRWGRRAYNKSTPSANLANVRSRHREGWVTPAPSGVALSMARRLELLAWARQSGSTSS
jgi:hypothetical protein